MHLRLAIIALLLAFWVTPVLADPAATANYRIPSDVQAVGGGDAAKSGNYVLLDTIGEPNIGDSGTANYKLNAGYRQTLETFISISGPATVNLGTIAGTGMQTGSGVWTVITDATAGYSLAWQASAATMTSGSDTVAAYTPVSANVPEAWSIVSTDSEWGGRLASVSTDAAAEWGTDVSSEKYLNVATSSRVVTTRTSRTSITGSLEKFMFRAEVGASKIQLPGTYTVTVTLTATSL